MIASRQLTPFLGAWREEGARVGVEIAQHVGELREPGRVAAAAQQPAQL
jgi:hypothetical protein